MIKELTKEIYKPTVPLLRCETKYPIVLIHGVGSRDRKHFNYWGRIPKSLDSQGAKIFYSNQDAWGTIEANSEIVKNSIIEALKTTGSDKVNLIAHSKGGLEARYLIHELDMESSVASLTTIATPHNGSKTMDLILKLPTFLYKFISNIMNFYYKLLGDKQPDFYTASVQLSGVYSKDFNRKISNSENIYYQSYATKMKNSFSDILFCLPHLIINLVDGENDGMVTVDSATWTNFRGVITGKHSRGISHADSVDFRRMNRSGIDMREIYMNIVEHLKDLGL